MVATERWSSCAPHPPCHSPPPMAQAPSPKGEMFRPVLPRGLVVPAVTRSSVRPRFTSRDPHRLGISVQRMVHHLDALHGGVVHVADLVEPRAEPASGPDLVLAQPRLDGPEVCVARRRRDGV